jgi:hypothetical protein
LRARIARIAGTKSVATDISVIPSASQAASISAARSSSSCES